jgi:hypothetical protein
MFNKIMMLCALLVLGVNGCGPGSKHSRVVVEPLGEIDVIATT